MSKQKLPNKCSINVKIQAKDHQKESQDGTGPDGVVGKITKGHSLPLNLFPTLVCPTQHTEMSTTRALLLCDFNESPSEKEHTPFYFSKHKRNDLYVPGMVLGSKNS